MCRTTYCAPPLDTDVTAADDTARLPVRGETPRERDVTPPAGGRSDGPLGLVVSAAGPREYEGTELLGRGGMGEVHLARDERVGRDVALKLLLDQSDGSSRMVLRFHQEARLQGRLEHPGVVPVYDLDRDRAGRSFFAMKRVVGVTLEEVLDGLVRGDAEYTARFPLQRLLQVFLQTCQTVDYAHSKGVIHRDLKPSNLMLGDFGEVYVLDWGIAKASDRVETPGDAPRAVSGGDSETRSDLVMGTLGYMAPEQITDPKNVDVRSDVYSLGVVLFAILTRDRLHQATAPAELARSTLSGVDARPSVRAPQLNVPPELDAICTTATALSPRKRYPSVRALHDAVQRYVDGDRDTRVRVELAERHLAEARRILAEEPGSATTRRGALREAGRALALDPTNADAARTVTSLMLTPPNEMPADVARETRALSMQELTRARSAAGLAFPALLALVGLMVWVGVRSWMTVGMLVVPLMTAFWLVRSPRVASNRVVSNVCVAAALGLAIAASSRIAGPLWLPPLFALGYVSVIIGTHGLGRWRLLCVALAMSGVMVPWGLESVGVTDTQYTFRDGQMCMVPGAVDLDPQRAEVALGLSSMAVIALVAVVLWHFSASDMNARRQLQLMAWHLRQMAPVPDVRDEADTPPPPRAGDAAPAGAPPSEDSTEAQEEAAPEDEPTRRTARPR